MGNFKVRSLALLTVVSFFLVACNGNTNSTTTSGSSAPPSISIIAPYGTGSNAYFAAGPFLYSTDGSSVSLLDTIPGNPIIPITQIKPFGNGNSAYVSAGSTLYITMGGSLTPVDTLPGGAVISQVQPFGIGGGAYVAAGSALYTTNGALMTLIKNTPNGAPISQIVTYGSNGDAYVAAGSALYNTDDLTLFSVDTAPNKAVISQVLLVGTSGSEVYVAAGSSLYSTDGVSLTLIGTTNNNLPILEVQLNGTNGAAYIAAGSSLYSTNGSTMTFIDTLNLTTSFPPITQVQLFGTGGSAFIAAGPSLYSTDGSAVSHIGDTQNNVTISLLKLFGTGNGAFLAAGPSLYSTNSSTLTLVGSSSAGSSGTTPSPPNPGPTSTSLPPGSTGGTTPPPPPASPSPSPSPSPSVSSPPAPAGVPQQFAGLLTNTVDYTLNSSVFVNQDPATVTAYSILGNNVTFTAANSFSGGELIGVAGLTSTAGEAIDGVAFTVTSASANSFTVSSPLFFYANTSTTSDNGTASLAWNASPTFGGCATDSTYHVTACRPPLPTDCPATTANPSGNCATNPYGWNVDYSKAVPWSQDMTMYVALDPSGWVYFYTISGGTYTFLRRAQSGSASGSPDASDGAGLYNDLSNWTWSNTPGTHTMYYTGSSPASGGNRVYLKTYNPVTNAAAVVHDFTSVVAGYSGGVSVDEDREGNPSDDDRYWAFAINDSNGSSLGFITYDKTADSVIANKTSGANGICGASPCQSAANWIGFSPSGKYVIINWDCSSHGWTWSRGCGTEVFDKNLNYLGVVDVQNGHADVGYDVNGQEVYVTIPDDLLHTDYYAVAVVNLANVATSIPTCSTGTNCINGHLPVAGERTVNFPCDFAWTPGTTACGDSGSTLRGKGPTLSMRATQGSGMGWALYSIMDGGTTNVGSGGYGAGENLAVQINWSTAYPFPNDGTNGTPATVVRLGRHHDVNSNNNYTAQADGVPNKNFTAYAWTSHYDINWSDGSRNGSYENLFTILP